MIDNNTYVSHVILIIQCYMYMYIDTLGLQGHPNDCCPHSWINIYLYIYMYMYVCHLHECEHPSVIYILWMKNRKETNYNKNKTIWNQGVYTNTIGKIKDLEIINGCCGPWINHRLYILHNRIGNTHTLHIYY